MCRWVWSHLRGSCGEWRRAGWGWAGGGGAVSGGESWDWPGPAVREVGGVNLQVGEEWVGSNTR